MTAIRRELQDKASLLRPLEAYCYQIAYYLLQNEREAHTAAERALAALLTAPLPLDGGLDERRRLVKESAVRACLALKSRPQDAGAKKAARSTSRTPGRLSAP